MKLNSIISLEVEKDGHLFSFNMPVGSSWGSCYNAAFEVLLKIVDLSREAAEKARPADDPTDALR